ncbi:MAG: type II toxin-antitoxin system RelE/ParE family toxin [Desulfobacterales bacterium]|nr:type II toxin-antitoxin system RelE/ParE family toxin [Desulfobacterales bacterium]
MRYSLAFLPSALKEWRKLAQPLRDQFKKKLAERLENPHVPGDRLRGYPNHYKIKLRASGYRLVYEVEENELRVLVIAVGHRAKGKVYRIWKKRLARNQRDS